MTHQTDFAYARDLAKKEREAVPELLRVLINNTSSVRSYTSASIARLVKTRRISGIASMPFSTGFSEKV